MLDDPRWGDDPHDRDDDNHRPHLGRGPGSNRDEASEHDPRRRDDERWPERDRDPRDQNPRNRDPRDVFMRNLDLPRGRDREIVYDPRDREYTLGGSPPSVLNDLLRRNTSPPCRDEPRLARVQGSFTPRFPVSM